MPEAGNLLSWLNAMPLFPKFYWENREGNFAIAGCGISKQSADYTFTWQSFCSKSSPEWNDFSLAPFSPQFEMRIENGRLFPSKLKGAEKIIFERPRIKTTISSPDRKLWIAQVQNSLALIHSGELEKVVLARRVQIDCETSINALALFSHLKKPGQSAFFLQPTPTSAFLGSSPERLYKRKKRFIECDALAGTRPKSLGQELLRSKKDLHEFNIVKNTLIKTLQPLCLFSPTASPIALAKTPTLCHLHSNISGCLREGIDDLSLLKVLHPTPAVGGMPRKTAASFLANVESFSRGLYAAPIGFIGENRAEFTVGIRSCLVTDSRAYLFAGTGIVEGSDPETEWEESEQKLLQWRPLFL